MKRPRTAGFSIIELAVVTMIIGLLTVLAIPRFELIRNSANATVTANDIRQFREAIEVYSTEQGGYPNDMSHTDIPSTLTNQLPRPWVNGNYSWTYQKTNQLTYLNVEVQNLTAEQALKVDDILDDGSIVAGDLRIANQGRGLNYYFQIK